MNEYFWTGLFVGTILGCLLCFIALGISKLRKPVAKEEAPKPAPEKTVRIFNAPNLEATDRDDEPTGQFQRTSMFPGNKSF